MRHVVALGLALAIAACGSGESPTAQAPDAARPKAAAPEKPVVMEARREYACADKTKLTVEWMSDQRSAKVVDGGKPHEISSALPGGMLNGEGYVVRGGKDAAQIRVTRPKGDPTNCTAA